MNKLQIIFFDFFVLNDNMIKDTFLVHTKSGALAQQFAVSHTITTHMRSSHIEPLAIAGLVKINSLNAHNKDAKTFVKPKELKLLTRN